MILLFKAATGKTGNSKDDAEVGEDGSDISGSDDDEDGKNAIGRRNQSPRISLENELSD